MRDRSDEKVEAGEMTKRGGTDLERLFLEDSEFADKTNIAGVDMPDLIARHKGRYALCGLFLRPGFKILDFPCGSGYASRLLEPFGADYLGLEHDDVTIQHARAIYGGPLINFAYGDLTAPNLPNESFDTIGCIEGLEHIEGHFQIPLLQSFYLALKPGGTLIVSSPEALEVSGPNPKNPYHFHELTRNDFLVLLNQIGFAAVEIISHTARLSTGQLGTCLYGVCHK